MEFPRWLLNIGLMLTTASVFCDERNDLESMYRLPVITIPCHYNVSLVTHLEKGDIAFYGKTSVVIKILHLTPTISLHSKKLEISKEATTLIDDNGNIYEPLEHTYNHAMNILTLRFATVFPYGFYTLNMEFVGNFSENGLNSGFIKMQYTNKEGNSTLAVTFFKPNKARQVFPCWDEPELKATFNISVMHHRKYRVLSNMPMREQPWDKMAWCGRTSRPLQPSLTSQARFVHGVAENITSVLLQYTNSFETAPKIDHVLIHYYPTYSLEHWGPIIYNELNVIYNSTDPTFRRKSVASLVARELLHHWFGNLVTPSWWSHVWLMATCVLLHWILHLGTLIIRFSSILKCVTKLFLIRILDELLAYLGYEENPDDVTKLLRLDATKWACTIGHDKCQKTAADKLNKYLEDPDTNTIPQWWQDWTYCFGLTTADRITWDKVSKLYIRNRDEKILEGLCCAEDSNIIISYLFSAATKTLFDDEVHHLIFNTILEKHARNDWILDYILDNFESINQIY
ncbi:PREDICTED: glutamyl aminopeptidase-like [Vollenhovia emeryi]|uniref:glutamyl aminopeptidase-like n=1 Tax=Vollenhovia emeryi TaxID=411798 RepID=UPI0005F3D1E1|nr:PREDICTED: glutamyl aminopeptidase-like [Vollenhovia emeryi]